MGVMAVRGTLSHWINYFFGEGRGQGEIARLKDFKKRGKKKIFGGSDQQKEATGKKIRHRRRRRKVWSS